MGLARVGRGPDRAAGRALSLCRRLLRRPERPAGLAALAPAVCRASPAAQRHRCRAAPCRRPTLRGQPSPPAVGARPRRRGRSRLDPAWTEGPEMSDLLAADPAEAENIAGGAIRAQRPENVPEKFWDNDAGGLRADALLKSYMELERKLGTSGREPEPEPVSGAAAAPEPNEVVAEQVADAPEPTPLLP